MPSNRFPVITNLIDLLEDSGYVTSVNRSARNLGLHLAGIVESATAHPAGPLIATALPCRRRPARSPCPGHVLVQRAEIPPEITWQCPVCEDNGVVSGWEGTLYDTRDEILLEREGPLTGVHLSDEQYAALRSSGRTEISSCRLIAAATHDGDGVVLLGTHGEIAELAAEVAGKGDLARSLARQRLFGAAFDALDAETGLHAPPERAVRRRKSVVVPQVRQDSASAAQCTRLCRRIDEVLSIPRMEYKYMQIFLRTLDYTLEAIEAFAEKSPAGAMDVYLYFLKSVPRVAGLVHEDESEMGGFYRALCGAALSVIELDRISEQAQRSFLSAMIASYHEDRRYWFEFVPEFLRKLTLGTRDRAWLAKEIAALPIERDSQRERMQRLVATVQP